MALLNTVILTLQTTIESFFFNAVDSAYSTHRLTGTAAIETKEKERKQKRGNDTNIPYFYETIMFYWDSICLRIQFEL